MYTVKFSNSRGNNVPLKDVLSVFDIIINQHKRNDYKSKISPFSHFHLRSSFPQLLVLDQCTFSVTSTVTRKPSKNRWIKPKIVTIIMTKWHDQTKCLKRESTTRLTHWQSIPPIPSGCFLGVPVIHFGHNDLTHGRTCHLRCFGTRSTSSASWGYQQRRSRGTWWASCPCTRDQNSQ